MFPTSSDVYNYCLRSLLAARRKGTIILLYVPLPARKPKLISLTVWRPYRSLVTLNYVYSYHCYQYHYDHTT